MEEYDLGIFTPLDFQQGVSPTSPCDTSKAGGQHLGKQRREIFKAFWYRRVIYMLQLVRPGRDRSAAELSPLAGTHE